MTEEVVAPVEAAPVVAPVDTEVAAPVAEATPAAPAVPAEYAEFTVAEGATVHAEVATEVKALAKDLGLTQEAAQKLYDKGAGMQARQQQALQDGLKTAREGWVAEAKADKEIGGQNYDANMAAVAAAKTALASPGLIKLLDDSGLGDHPEMVRLFLKAGKSISQDTPFTAGRPAAELSEEERAQRMYPSMARKAA